MPDGAAALRSVPEPGSGPSIEEYRLRMDIDFARKRWTGSVEFDLPPGLRSFALDAVELSIDSVERNRSPAPFRLDPTEQKLTIELGHREASTISVEFHGQVVDQNLTGLYACRHGDSYVLTSHCEPVGARRIFPCVDRPDSKSRIDLFVRTDPDLEVVFNTPVESVRDESGRRAWSFVPTPTMATYLFFLAVGRFDHTEARSGRIPVRVLTAPGRAGAARFAAESGARILAALEEYFGIPYPLPKLDLIAFEDHSVGAMENWGAVSFLEMRLLVDDDSSSYTRRDVFETLAHELAHQWFGDLVTMEWWDDIWLNESFATFLETKVTERLAPEYNPFADFVVRPWGVAAARFDDSLRATHPVRASVNRPQEIEQIFDSVSYGKGSGLLSMLEHYLGEKRFRSGVTGYLTRFAYRNARTEDLWEALERSSGEPVRRLMGPWIDRAGLPVVEARLVSEGLSLRQRRFSFYGAEDAPPWPIPIEVDAGGERRSVLLDRRELTVPLPSGAPVHLNPGGFGFYRVWYEPPLLDRLFATLGSRPSADRWVVLNDLGAFLASGDVDWPTYARGLRAASGPPDRLHVSELVDTLGHWTLAFPSVIPLGELFRDHLADQVERLGVDRRPGEAPEAGVVRETLVHLGVRVDATFARTLSDRFTLGESLDPDLRFGVAIARVRSEGEGGYREVDRARERAASEAERSRLDQALAWSGVPSLVKETLGRLLSGRIQLGHLVSVVREAATNPVGRPLVGPWLETHLARVEEMLRGTGFLSQLFDETLPWLGLERPEETRRFFRDRPTPEGSRGLARGLEHLELLERLRRRWPDE